MFYDARPLRRSGLTQSRQARQQEVSALGALCVFACGDPISRQGAKSAKEEISEGFTFGREAFLLVQIVDDAGDAILDQWSAEVDQQAQVQAGHAQVSEKLFGMHRRDLLD